MSPSFDVVVVVDTTGSMDSYLHALQRFIPQLLALRSITSDANGKSPIERVGILSYTDYYSPPVVNPSQTSVENPVPTSDAAAKALIPKLKVEDVVGWSGWVGGKTGPSSGEVLVEWAKGLTAEGGGDYPEAAKSALKFLLELVAPSRPAGDPVDADELEKSRDTIVLWYTDSPPHHRSQRGINRLIEIAAHNPPPNSRFASSSSITKDTLKAGLNRPAPHPDPSDLPKMSRNHGESCTDWVDLCLAAEEARLKVYTILPPSTSDLDVSFWVLLGEITRGGACAIGGKRTGDTESVRGQADVLASYVIGGGDFVRTVMKFSVAVVLDALRGDPVVVGGSDGKGQDPSVEEGLSKDTTKVEASDDPLDLKQLRWLTYKSPDIRQYLPSASQSTVMQGNVAPSESPSAALVSATLDPEQAKLAPGDGAHIMKDEDEGSQGFLPSPWNGSHLGGTMAPVRGIQRTGTAESVLGKRLANALALQIGSLDGVVPSTREEQRYWDEVMDSLKGVVNTDVESVVTVPIFSEMWRSVSRRSSSNARDMLFSTFIARASKIRDTEKRERLLQWANMNHDASTEILRLLETRRIGSTSPSGLLERKILIMDQEASQLSFSREQLLSITTSCDKNVLKEAGYMLRYTRLLTVNDVVAEATFINLSTTPPSVLFQVLPHLLIPGTLYSERTASILAIIAVTAHIPHLLEPAKALLESAKGTWINPSAPENFSTPFIGFMLSIPSSQSLLLSPEEHDVYHGMARYAHLEENIDTKIQAKVPWTPMKTRGVGDRKRKCDGCGIRRSETMMHEVGSYALRNTKAGKKSVENESDNAMRCGMCVDSDTKDPKDWKDRGEIESCWVECSERWCRAQYVIEDEEGLRIPPRCYYCRKRKPSPWIECTQCANRIILPKSYRVQPADSPSQFVCPPCQNVEHTGHKTVVHKLTTLRSILFANEYEVGWLGVRPFREIFRGRSTFVIWELYGNAIFAPLAPSITPPPALSPSMAMEKRKRLLLNGKKLLNPQELKEELDDIAGRAMKKEKVLCGMTFAYFEAGDIVPACGNAGCDFTAGKSGLHEWYSGSGTRRKRCPSCNRQPVAQI